MRKVVSAMVGFEIARALYIAQLGYCAYTNEFMYPFGTRSYMTIDHIAPKSSGRDDDLQNLVACTAAANSSKGKRTLEEYCAKRGFSYLEVKQRIQKVYYRARIVLQSDDPLNHFDFEPCIEDTKRGGLEYLQRKIYFMTRDGTFGVEANTDDANEVIALYEKLTGKKVPHVHVTYANGDCKEYYGGKGKYSIHNWGYIGDVVKKKGVA